MASARPWRVAILVIAVAGQLIANTESSFALSKASNCNSSSIAPSLKAVTYPTPIDREISFQLGPISISTTSPVTITDLENGTYLRFVLKNSASVSTTVRIPNVETLELSKPSWTLHMSLIRDGVLSADGSYDVVVPAGGSETVAIYMSRDAEPGNAKATWTIKFQLPPSGVEVSIPLELRSEHGTYGPDGKRLPVSAMIQGTVKGPNGKPLPNAEVTAFLTSGELRRYTKTDSRGKFSISLISDPGLAQLSGGRLLSPAASWNLTVDAGGYGLWSISPLSLAHGQVRKCEVSLAKIGQRSYQILATIHSPNGYGAWDSLFFGNGDRFVVAPGLHGPDNANAPIAIRAYDLRGNELWSVPVDSVRDYGVYQMSVSRDGRLIAATSNDGYLRVISESGELVHKRRVFWRMNSSAGSQFSPDGSRLVTGADVGIIVLDTSTWEIAWQSSANMYRGFWSDTEAELLVGSVEGLVTSFTRDGRVRWRRGVGYVPFHVFADSTGRVTATGKARMMRSWDANGNPLWAQAVAHTSNRTSLGHGASLSGNLIIAATFNGLDQAFDASGRLLWMRWLPVHTEPDPSGGTMFRVPGPGHAGTYVATDGSFVVHGSRANQVVMFGRDGSLLWKSERFPTKSGYPDGGHYNPGANTVLASSDGRIIIAGFADAVIRIFTLK